jgi:hypothetical protein
MTRFAALLLTVFFGQVALADTPLVEAFLEDPVELLDDQGKLQRELALKDAPTKPLPILQYNEALDLVQVELTGQKVWLDSQNLRVNMPLNVVNFPCQKLPVGKASDSQNNATMGYGAGCNR